MSVDAAAPIQARTVRTGFRTALGTLWQSKTIFVSVLFLLLLVIVAVFAPLVAPHSPTQVEVLHRLQPPFWQAGGSTSHLLGTDKLGRDILSRLVYGARISLLVGASVVVISSIFGTCVGLLAGYKGGLWDTLIMRLADAQLAFPGLLLVLMVITFLGSSLQVIIGVIAVYGWMIYARLVRGIVLQLRSTPAVQAAELLGARTPRILFRHLLPMLYAPLLTQAMLELARVVLVEASLSYLGLGVQPPNASWGLMVAESQDQLRQAWWPVVFPGLALALTVLCVNLVANWLRIQADPQQRQRQFGRGFGRGSVEAFEGGDEDAPTVPEATPGLPLAGPSPRDPEEPAPGLVDDDRELPAPAGGEGGIQPAAADHPLLSIEHLEVRYHTTAGEVSAVRDASLAVQRGETIGIVGESGSGKSTLALALMDLIPPPGRIKGVRMTWEGKRLSRAALHRLRGSDVTMIFQDPMTSLSPLVPVGRQVAEVLTKHKGMSKADARTRVEELFEMVGIASTAERFGQYPHELSGGLRQRVMIAAALAPEPKLVIADEPTTALDATIQAQILEIIADLQRQLGIAMVLITHDLGVVARACDRVIVMYGGRVVEDAPVFELFDHPRHRYTEALLEALPHVDRGRGELMTIPGHPPGRTEQLPGCPFAPRCAHATEECAAMPDMTVETDRRFACWHPSTDQQTISSPKGVGVR